MRVLQINTVCGYGSTGRNVTELAQALVEQGDECHIAYGQGTTSYANSYKIGTRLENHLHNIQSRLFGKQGYYTRRGTRRLIQYIQTLQPDIIHLGNLHGNYLNLRILFEYLADSQIPVVWTLHDCWAFTGKCSHYTSAKCGKWKTACGKCPIFRQYPPSHFFDRSSLLHADKKRWFTAVENMTIVPVSHWLAGEVSQSFLGKYPVIPIHNWIDLTVFKLGTPQMARATRKKYGIPEDAFVVLGVSAGWNDRKHSQTASKLIDFRALQARLSEHDDIQLVLVGSFKDPDRIPAGAISIPYVDDIRELAAIYAMADVYVHLSMEDTFGKVIAEAMACGTPAIVYNSTGCPEVVGEGCGFTVEKRNIENVYQAILRVKYKEKNSFSLRCVEFSKERFSLQEQTKCYNNLYNKIVDV